METVIDNYENVCRLCLGKDGRLESVFEKNGERVKKKVFITTGVEILTSDFISQMICHKCYDIVFKMWKFRKSAIQNDRFLKKTYFESSKMGIKAQFNTEARTSTATKPSPNIPAKDNIKQNQSVAAKDQPKTANNQIISQLIPNKIHSSVSELLNRYPNLKIAASCLRFNVSPDVNVGTDVVANYFKDKNVDFNKQMKIALELEQNMVQCSDSLVSDQSISSQVSNITDKCSLTEKLKKNFSAIVQSKRIADVDPSNIIKRKAESDFSEESAKRCKEAQLETAEVLLHQVKRGVPALICNVCNAVHYNKRDLKRHKQKHSRCQFCRMYLPNMERKEEHLKNSCEIKLAMLNINAIKIPMTRLDYDKEVTAKYPKVLQWLQVNRKKKKSPLTIVPGVIELSDDEDNTPSTTTSICELQNIQSNKAEVSKTTGGTSSPSSVNSDAVEENVVYNTVSLVRPDIVIKDSNLIDQYDPKLSDILVLKDLINKGAKESQTSLQEIHSSDITGDSTIVFNSLRKQVEMHTIQVNVQNGFLKVAYELPKEPPNKHFYPWNYSNVVRLMRVENVIEKKFPAILPRLAQPSSNTSALQSVTSPAPKVVTSLAPKTVTSLAPKSVISSAPQTVPSLALNTVKCSAPQAMTCSTSTFKNSTISAFTMCDGTVLPTVSNVFTSNDVSALQHQTGIIPNNSGKSVTNKQDSFYVTNNSGIINNVLLCNPPETNAPINFININVPNDPNSVIQVSDSSKIVNNPTVNISWPNQSQFNVQNPNNVFHLIPNTNFQLGQPQFYIKQNVNSGIKTSGTSIAPTVNPSTTSVDSSNNLTIFNNIIVANEEASTANQLTDETLHAVQSILPQGTIRVKPMWELT